MQPPAARLGSHHPGLLCDEGCLQCRTPARLHRAMSGLCVSSWRGRGMKECDYLSRKHEGGRSVQTEQREEVCGAARVIFASDPWSIRPESISEQPIIGRYEHHEPSRQVHVRMTVRAQTRDGGRCELRTTLSIASHRCTHLSDTTQSFQLALPCPRAQD